MAERQERELGQLQTDVRHLLEGQARLETQMDNGFADLKEQFSTRLDIHSKRLGVLERWKAWIMGALAVLGLITSALVSWALKGQ